MKRSMESNKSRKRTETDRVGLQLEKGRSRKETLRWLFSRDVEEVNKTDVQTVFQVEEQQGQRLRDRSVPGMFKELSGSQWSCSGVSKGKRGSSQGQRQARSFSTWALWELWSAHDDVGNNPEEPVHQRSVIWSVKWRVAGRVTGGGREDSEEAIAISHIRLQEPGYKQRSWWEVVG